jgi:hypothetical protein
MVASRETHLVGGRECPSVVGVGPEYEGRVRPDGRTSISFTIFQGTSEIQCMIIGRTRVAQGKSQVPEGRGAFAGSFAQQHSQGVGVLVADFPGDRLQGLFSGA